MLILIPHHSQLRQLAAPNHARRSADTRDRLDPDRGQHVAAARRVRDEVLGHFSLFSHPCQVQTL